MLKLFVPEEPADDGFHAWATATLKRMKAGVDGERGVMVELLVAKTGVSN